MATRRHLLSSAVALTLCLLAAPLASVAAAAPGSAGGSVPRRHTDPTLEDETGLRVSIDDLRPAALTPGKPLKISGVVANFGDLPWRDAQIYLDVDATPATTKLGLEAFVEDEPFGTRLTSIGLFDEIGALQPGTSETYSLTIPYDDLPISQSAGVYHLGVSVLATSGQERDLNADARADTLIPMLDEPAAGLSPTSVVTLVPITGPVIRRDDGTFLDDRLAGELSFGGRLRNLLDFATGAPTDSLQLEIDPALVDAIRDMGDGYEVQRLGELADGIVAREGAGQADARAWLTDLRSVMTRQHVQFLPWGTPDVTTLADHHLAGVVDAGVLSSATYAAEEGIDGSVIGWPLKGAATREALAVAHRAGTRIQVVAERSLPHLENADPATYPPAQVTIGTSRGPLTALVARRDVAGRRVTKRTTAVQFRQAVMAEATVRAMSDQQRDPLSVVAVPFDWNPGAEADRADIAAGFEYATVAPVSATAATEHSSVSYSGPVTQRPRQLALPDDVLRAIVRLQQQGRTLTGLLSDRQPAVSEFTRALAMSGSVTWRRADKRGAALIRRQARTATGQLRQVRVTGPTFVALSSDSGRFPLTVSNGLDVPVSVNVKVMPANPALKIEPIEPVELAPGQHRDILVHSRADGSGVTPVRVRLSTTDGRRFGAPWEFDVRATQIGVAIWIVMGVGGAILFGAAGMRIARRLRSPGALTPREEPRH